MKVSRSWLSDHVDFDEYSNEQLDDLLTFAGIEVEEIESSGCEIDHLVVGEIVSFEKHPDADKLSVCKVDDGSGTLRQIVCGAKNFKAGDHVPLALPGCQLSPTFEIKVGKLRGVESAGMLCAASEIGLAKSSDGLLILDPETKPGTPIRDLFDSDTIFTLEITPNRPDCLSHLGTARELAALAKSPLKKAIDHSESTTSTKTAAGEITLSTESCPLYTGRWIRGVKVGESPDWLKQRLEAIGLRPINNIVDITNYVLMEMGHPLHAFDLAKLEGGKIEVRQATEGEAFLALDGETYALTEDDCVIADASRPVAIAGVMGGEDSGVTETTTDVLLEAAYFVPSHVRRTARRLTLHSDSSYRFERGTDPYQVAGASDLAVKLITEIAGGTADEALIVAGEAPAAPAPVAMSNDACRKLIGHEIPDAEIDGILERLGLEKAGAEWKIPSYRLDLEREVDLIEEVARTYGLDNVPSSTVARFAPSSKADAAYDLTRSLSTQLAALGFCETRNLKLISGATQLADDRATTHRGMSPIRLKHPLNDEQDYLRPGLVPGLLATAARNVRFDSRDLRLFEFGRVFTATPKGQEIEHEHFALLMTGKSAERSWIDGTPSELDLYALRGVIESLCPGQKVALKAVEDDRLLCAATIDIGKTSKLGMIGIVPPDRARELGIDAPILVAELNFKKLSAALAVAPRFEDLPRFPAISRDIAMEVPADLSSGEIDAFFAKQNIPLLVGYGLFDVFTDPSGEKLAADKKSLAWSVTYRTPERTLEMPEVEKVHADLLAGLKKAFPIDFR